MDGKPITILNFMPSSALSVFGHVYVPEPGADEPATNSLSYRTFILRTFICGRLKATQTQVSGVGVPRYVNFVASKRAPGAPRMVASGVEDATIAIAVPSLGAMLQLELAATRPPAPGMFCGTTT